MKVAILVPLTHFDDAYSVCHVVRDQCRMFADNDVPYTLFLPRSYRGEPREDFFQDIRAATVLSHISPYVYDFDEERRSDYIERVNRVLQGDQTGIGYRAATLDATHVITHEMVQCPWFLEHRAALKSCEGPRFFHWSHNILKPPPEGAVFPYREIYQNLPFSIFVYPSEHSALLSAERLPNTATASYVTNPRDIRDVCRFSDLTNRLIAVLDLFDHDILQVYSFDTVRWRSKGVPALLKLFACFHRRHKKVKLVLVNAHANGPAAATEVKRLTTMAERFGLVMGEHVHLISDFSPDGLPHDVVCDLVVLSNLFVFPSDVECCSLVWAEAAVTGKLLALNSSFSPLAEFAGSRTFAYPFSDWDPERDDHWYGEVADLLLEQLDRCGAFDRSKAIGETYNRDWIWEHQLFPLLEGL